MPSVNVSQVQDLTRNRNDVEALYNAPPSFGETLTAQFRRENIVVNAGNAIFSPEFEQENGYRSLVDEDLTGYEDQWRLLAGARSRSEFKFLKGKIDQEREDLNTIQRSGLGSNLLTGAAAGLLDPTILIPGYNIAKSLKVVQTAVKAAAIGAATAAISQSINEFVLQKNQVLRTSEESLQNIEFAAMFGGVLGGGIGAIGAKLNAKVAEEIAEQGTLAGQLVATPGDGSVGAAVAERVSSLVEQGTLTEKNATRVLQDQILEFGRRAGEEGDTRSELLQPRLFGFTDDNGKLTKAANKLIKGMARVLVRDVRVLYATSDIPTENLIGRLAFKSTFSRYGSEALAELGTPLETIIDTNWTQPLERMNREIYDQDFRAFVNTLDPQQTYEYRGHDPTSFDGYNLAVGSAMHFPIDQAPEYLRPAIRRVRAQYDKIQQELLDWGLLGRGDVIENYAPLVYLREGILKNADASLDPEFGMSLHRRLVDSFIEKDDLSPKEANVAARDVINNMMGGFTGRDPVKGQIKIGGRVMQRKLTEYIPVEDLIDMGVVNTSAIDMNRHMQLQLLSRLEAVKKFAPGQSDLFWGVRGRLNSLREKIDNGTIDESDFLDARIMHHELPALRTALVFSNKVEFADDAVKIVDLLEERASLVRSFESRTDPKPEALARLSEIDAELKRYRHVANESGAAEKILGSKLPEEVDDLNLDPALFVRRSFGAPGKQYQVKTKSGLPRSVAPAAGQIKVLKSGLNQLNKDLQKAARKLEHAEESLARAKSSGNKDKILKATNTVQREKAAFNQLSARNKTLTKSIERQEKLLEKQRGIEEPSVTVSKKNVGEENRGRSLYKVFDELDAQGDSLYRSYAESGINMSAYEDLIERDIRARDDLTSAQKDDMVNKAVGERLAGVKKRLYHEQLNPNNSQERVIRGLMFWNYTRIGGFFGLPATADPIGQVFAHRFGPTLRAWRATLIDREVLQNFQAKGIEAMELGFNAHLYDRDSIPAGASNLATITGAIKHGTYVENGVARRILDNPVFRKLGFVEDAGKKLKVNGFSFWSFLNQISSINARTASLSATDSILSLAQKVAAGKKIPKRALAEMADDAGVTSKDLAAFLKEWEGAGSPTAPRSGLILSNSEKWANRELAQKFDQLVTAQTRRAVFRSDVSDRPFFMDEGVGRLIFQFMSFGIVSADNIVLGSLSRGLDPRLAEGMVATLLWGSVVAALRETNRNFTQPEELFKDAREAPASFVVDAIDQSGVLGSFATAHGVWEKLTGIGFHTLLGGQGSGRFKSRNKAGAMLGPTYGLLDDVGRIIGHVGSGEIRQSTAHSARRLLPLQNLAGLRQVMDVAEEALIHVTNIPERIETE